MKFDFRRFALSEWLLIEDGNATDIANTSKTWSFELSMRRKHTTALDPGIDR